jgi:hypothetical protein
MEGYRFEWITADGLRNFTGTRSKILACKGCRYTTPNPKCDCGLRVVPTLQALSDYIEEFQTIRRIANISDLELPVERNHTGKREHVLGLAICKVRTIGHMIPGNPVDPEGTVRAGRLELLEVHATTKHLTALGELHPVPVEALGQLPVKFPAARNPRTVNNTVTDHGAHFGLKLAHYRFDIHKTSLQERDLHRMERLLGNPNSADALALYRQLIRPALGTVPQRHIGPLAIGTAEFLTAMAYR